MRDRDLLGLLPIVVRMIRGRVSVSVVSLVVLSRLLVEEKMKWKERILKEE